MSEVCIPIHISGKEDKKAIEHNKDRVIYIPIINKIPRNLSKGILSNFKFFNSLNKRFIRMLQIKIKTKSLKNNPLPN